MSQPPTPRHGPRSAWPWLLVVPVLAVIWPPLYNHTDPKLFSLPFFYWYQLAVVPVGVICTVLVYRNTRHRIDAVDAVDAIDADRPERPVRPDGPEGDLS